MKMCHIITAQWTEIQIQHILTWEYASLKLMGFILELPKEG